MPPLEMTIDCYHKALRDNTITCERATKFYMDRITKLDSKLNSMTYVDHAAVGEAQRLDAYFKETGKLFGPLHGVIFGIKDQLDTADMPTSYGNKIYANYRPPQDATVVRLLREAGAIIIGKNTLPDFATSWFSTSSRSGSTSNPFNLSHDAGGSSSGTAASVSANLVMAGIGGDTGGSIRLPASFCGIVGVRVTPGIISRHGMSPLVVVQDTPGPMTRTVLDSARILDCIVGYDHADQFSYVNAFYDTATSHFEAAKMGQLRGKRLGVLRQAFGNKDEEEKQVSEALAATLMDLSAAGAELVDIEIPDLMRYVTFTSLYYTESREDINNFLRDDVQGALPSLDKIYQEKNYHPSLDLLEGIAQGPEHSVDDPNYAARIKTQAKFQRVVANLIIANNLEAIVFPDAKLHAPSHSEIASSLWTCLTYPTNTIIASQLRFPAVTVPAAVVNGFPIGLEFMGLPFKEKDLLGLAYSFEQYTNVRAKDRPNL